MKRAVILLAVFLTLCLIWEVACLWGKVPSYILPAPHKILQALVADWSILLSHSWVSLQESLLGLGFATAMGVSLALFMDLHALLRETLQALLVLSQCIPTLVLAPLLMIWLGFGLAPKIVVVVLMCFYPITLNISAGLQKVSLEQLALLKSLGANTVQIYRLAKIPAALPYLFSGLRIAATYAISAAVIGEWLSSKAGLGYYMIRVSNAYQLDKVFASLFLIIFWSLLLNLLVVILAKCLKPGRGYLAQIKIARAERELLALRKEEL